MLRKTHRLILIPIILLAILLGGACQPTDARPTPPEGAVQVTVSILPQAYFVERIGGDRISATIMVGPGEEAHTYEPTPDQMKSLTASQAFFTIGVEYEQTWLPRFADINPQLRFVDSASGIERLPMTADHAHEQDQDQAEEGLLDPHVWLAPANGAQIADNILIALSELAPEYAGYFEQNHAQLIADITALDETIRSTFQDVEQRAFLVFHPAWGYFAHQYDLEQIAVQVGGQDPSASELAALVDIAREAAIQVVFIQPTFNAADAEAIAQEVGAEVAVVDPLARDWLANLNSVAQAFAAALKP